MTGQKPPKSWRPPSPVRKDYVPDREFGFERAPAPIPFKNVREHINTEFLVVGAGVSGIAAALSIAEKGGKVVMIEKTRSYQAFGGDNSFIGSRLQKQLGIKIDSDEVVLNLMKYGANRPNQSLLRMWAEGGAETIDWIMNMTEAAGLKATISSYPPPPAYDNASEYYPQYLSCHHFESERLLAKCLIDNAIEKGLVVHYNVRAKQLLRERKGRVTALIAQNSEGKYLRYNAAKAVLLCTGDYGNNSEMVAKYCPQVGRMGTILKTATGDGHQMAMWIGATMEPAPHAAMIHAIPGPLGVCAFLQVNLNGERFQNEDVLCECYHAALERQPGHEAWQVFDSKYENELPYMGIGLGKFIRVDDESRTRLEEQSIVSDSLEDLAVKMGLPVPTFLKTIARYNQLAREKKDRDFGKRADRLTTIEKPPFFAGKGFSWFLCAMGGLMTDNRLQPVDKNFEVIPGLFLGGNIIGNRFGVMYPSMLPGLSNGMALHFGRIAGLNAFSTS